MPELLHFHIGEQPKPAAAKPPRKIVIPAITLTDTRIHGRGSKRRNTGDVLHHGKTVGEWGIDGKQHKAVIITGKTRDSMHDITAADRDELVSKITPFFPQ